MVLAGSLSVGQHVEEERASRKDILTAFEEVNAENVILHRSMENAFELVSAGEAKMVSSLRFTRGL